MWTGGRVYALLLALCLVGELHLTLTASLKKGLQHETLDPVQHQSGYDVSVLRRARSALQWINPNVAVASVAAPGTQVAIGQVSNVLTPAPITITGADGTTSSLQLILLTMNVPPTSSQCLPNAAPISSTVLISAPGQTSSPTPVAAPSVFSGDYDSINKISAPDSLNSEAITTLKGKSGRRRLKGKRLIQPTSTLAPERDQPTVSPSIKRRTRSVPNFPPIKDSGRLVQQWRAQLAENPLQLPLLTDLLSIDMDEPEYSGYRGYGSRSMPVPPPPRFGRSMMLQAVLTVPSAEYSEPYTVWWDAASGAWRMDYHNDDASTYHMLSLDGLVQSIHVRLDRTGETDVRHCVKLLPRRGSPAERALPVLPDLTNFTFAGYVNEPTESGPVPVLVERWRYTTTGEGGFSNEVLTYRHELLVTRAADAYSTIPLLYSVAVDSSILGDNSDAYFHQFTKIRMRRHDPTIFNLDTGDACETIDETDQIDVVEPLREFAMIQRNPKYATEFQEYTELYERNYADDTEKTVRKNTLMQSSRFVSSGNRKGANFELRQNFLSDRLRAELNRLFGAVEGASSDAMPFPHSAEELKALRGRLPRNFDWRKRGAVTPVRFQHLCQSCWAFSVVGAVEGAFFKETGNLVPLSEQSLLDCGKPYGTNGCKPSWPHGAYKTVQDRGLPALDEYTPYEADVLECKTAEVPSVTRISGYVNVTSEDYEALKVAIRRHGPVVVLLDGKLSNFKDYSKGFYDDPKCAKDSSNHAMLAVGWTVHRGKTYFILKNSWSTGWGEEGYMNLRADTNTCGVLRMPSYPVLRNSDVLRILDTSSNYINPA